MKRTHDEAEASRLKAPNLGTSGLDMFSTGIAWPAPSAPTPTSEAAADRLTHTTKGRAKRERDLVTLLTLIASRESGYTRQELADESNIPLQTVCARVGYDLGPRGFIDAASTIKRDGRQVLFVAQLGRDFLRRAA